MDKPSGLKSVSLPDGDVTISTQPVESWITHNATGFVDPNNIAPDPENVRAKLSPAKMAGLRASIKTYGVKQPLIITPLTLAPWAKVAPRHQDCFFLAVSGHRRREGSVEEHIGAVPFMVKIYPSEKEHRMDVSLYNKDNEDLTDLEEGYEILKLQNLGWKIEELCKSFTYAAPQLYVRMNLTKLDKSLQALLDDELPTKQRLGSTLGGELGSVKEPSLEELEEIYEQLESSLRLVPKGTVIPNNQLESLDGNGRRFALQKALYSVIVLRGLSSDRAIQFVRERKLKLHSSGHHGGASTERFTIRKRKDSIDGLISSFNGSLLTDWKFEDWRKVLELSSREEVTATLGKFRQLRGKLGEMIDHLERIESLKKATRPEVLELMKRNK